MSEGDDFVSMRFARFVQLMNSAIDGHREAHGEYPARAYLSPEAWTAGGLHILGDEPVQLLWPVDLFRDGSLSGMTCRTEAQKE